MKKNNSPLTIQGVTYSVILITLAIYLLTISRAFIIPFVIASIIFYIFTFISGGIRKVIEKKESPFFNKIASPFAHVSTIIILSVGITGFVTIINTNVRAIRENIPKYEQTLREKIRSINEALGTDLHLTTGKKENPDTPFIPERDIAVHREFHRPLWDLPHWGQKIQQDYSAKPREGKNSLIDRILQRSPEWLREYIENIQIPNLLQLTFESVDLSFIQSLGGFFTDMARSTTITFIYLFLLILERKSLRQKMKRLANIEKTSYLITVIEKINRDLQGYLKIKTLASLLTGIISFAILTAFGVDFASFWALLIFTLNYIPTIGSIIAVLFPILLSFIQFDSLLSIALLSAALTSVQLAIGNIVEPRFLGKTLNLSPVIIFIFLILWGQIWGPVGMFLAVPILLVINIILSIFPQTRALAVLLSGDGALAATYRDSEKERNTTEINTTNT
ncbi:MAG: AI-2E family transporter [Fibrobacterota bacterium]